MGESGPLTIEGTPGPDQISIGIVDENLFASMNGAGLLFDAELAGEIILRGNGGNDQIVVTNFDNILMTLYGGEGDDLLSLPTADPDGAVFFGEAGNDTILGGPGDDIMDGGEGNDLLQGGDGNDAYRFGDAGATQTDTVSELSGQGADVLDFSDATGPVSVNLTSDKATAQQSNRTIRTAANGQASQAFENAIGGAGADSLRGNALDNLLLGGPGADDLRGDDGRDVLIGGAGADNLSGGKHDDLLFAGTTSYEADYPALLAIAQTWSGPDGFASRVAELQSGVGEEAAVLLQPGVSVFDDASIDQLNGGQQSNWYLGNIAGAGARDALQGFSTKSDLATDLL
jgi:Ca2+-binding RTX toxin-like protein